MRRVSLTLLVLCAKFFSSVPHELEPQVAGSSVQWWRDDLRCGANFKLSNGRPAECDPLHPKGFSCCSETGWCGASHKHCKCEKCVDYSATWRKDTRCGEEFPLHDGFPAQCDPWHTEGKTCCSDVGWCGGLPKHCSCPDCEDFTALWRKDLRCGPNFRLPNGMAAQCDPNSNKGYRCCSKLGWCGKTPQHCQCRGCVKYTTTGALVFSQSLKKWTKATRRRPGSE